MKILLISYNILDTASGIISFRVAKELANQGHVVNVVTSSKVQKNVKMQNENLLFSVVENILPSNSICDRLLSRIRRMNSCYFFNILWVLRAYIKAIKLVKEWKPDVVYCRSSPEEACYVGYLLTRKNNPLLIQHFSDPIPAPTEYLPISNKRSIMSRFVRRTIIHCDAVSYGNDSMKSFVYDELKIPQSQRFFISPDAASGSVLQHRPTELSDSIILTYLGNIYGGRNPVPLFRAISELNNNGIAISLNIYGTSTIHHDKYPHIYYFPQTNDIETVLTKSNILIDLDGDDDNPVFISSKLKDYLLIDRPILSITPINSPSRQLLTKCKSAISVENKTNDIIRAINALRNYDISEIDFEHDRAELIDLFSPINIVRNLLDKINEIKCC